MSKQIQVIGTLKCRETQKVMRFFKERKITPRFLDLYQKGLAKGELENITRSIPIEELIDKESKEFKSKNFQYMVFSPEDVILEYPLIMKTPVTRLSGKAILGFDKDKLTEFINLLKQ
ncbi:MAG: ArsC family transcriptional regulator [Candidatus Kapabacteria bacterium]|nr:ArsC family transcriptional regulator [Ignavibacteriota bacterium]MCW5886326.1 ArsC family transcriptional regulator [Candidatus Kapabacteria bacterium]